jgi:hypothetical protein
MKQQNKELVNSRGMAARINVSLRSLERHRAAGLIPYIPLTKRTYLYDPDKVFMALQALEVPGRLLMRSQSQNEGEV